MAPSGGRPGHGRARRWGASSTASGLRGRACARWGTGPAAVGRAAPAASDARWPRRPAHDRGGRAGRRYRGRLSGRGGRAAWCSGAGEGAQGRPCVANSSRRGLQGVAFVGGDAIRDRSYLEAVGPAGEGTLAAARASTSRPRTGRPTVHPGLPIGVRPASRRVRRRVLGRSPDPGDGLARWCRDARGLLLWSTRCRPLTASLRTYRFGSNGDCRGGLSFPFLVARRGGRWLELPSTPRSV